MMDLKELLKVFWLIKFKEKQFFSFFIIGIINTIFGLSVFNILILLSFSISLSILISTIVGVLFNYQTMKRLVFNQNGNSFLKFVSSYIFIYIIYNLFFILSTHFKFNIHISSVIIFTILPFFNYFILRKFVFNEKR